MIHFTTLKALANTAYFKNLIAYIKKKSLVVSIFSFLFLLSFCFIGFNKYKNGAVLSPEKQTLLAEYNENLKNYELSIAEAQENIATAQKQADETQRYIDYSIYMKLDPQNIYVSSAQYTVTTSANLGNIMSSLLYFVNEGGLKDGLSEQYPDLEVEYWKDIVFVGNSNNVYNITVYHYDADKGAKILSIVEDRLKAYVPEVIKKQGDFSFNKLNSSNFYTKADINVTNNQNNNRNNQKNYQNNLVDLQNKLTNQRVARDNYIEKNTPDFVDFHPASKTLVFKFTVFGLLLGLFGSVGLLILLYMTGSRMRSSTDLRDLGFTVLGTIDASELLSNPPCTENRMSLISQKLVLISEKKGFKHLYFDCPSEIYMNSDSSVFSSLYKNLTSSGLSLASGTQAFFDMGNMKSILATDGIIIVVESGKTTYEELKSKVAFCKDFSINILGTIVIE